MISAAIACLGRGRGCQRIVTAACDHEGCGAQLVITTRAEYVAAAELGWRRQRNAARCPAHAADFNVAAAS